MGYGMDLFELFNPKFVKCHWCHWYFHLPLPWIKVDKKNPPPTKRSSLEKKMLPFQSEKMVACYWQMGLTTDPPCFVIFHWDMNLAKTPANSVPFQMNNLDNLASCKSLQVLQRSGLTSADLAQIWSLSDVARGWWKRCRMGLELGRFRYTYIWFKFMVHAYLNIPVPFGAYGKKGWERRTSLRDAFFIHKIKSGGGCLFFIATKNLGEKLSLWDVSFHETKNRDTQCMIYLPTFPIKLTNQMWVNIYSIHWVSGHVFPVTSWCQIKGPSKVEMTGGATVSPFRSTASTSPSQSAQAPFLPCHNKLQISSNI